MCTSVRRIVDADHEVTREQALDSRAPLVDLGVSGSLGTQVASIAEAPFGELAVLVPLRRRQSCREWILQSGILRLVKILGEIDWSRLVKGRARVLEVGGDAGSVVNTGAGPDHRLRIPAIGPSQSGREVVSINRYRAIV